MEILIVILVVIAAAVYVGRVFYRGLRRQGDCASGCTCCDLADSCRQPTTDSSSDRATSRADS